MFTAFQTRSALPRETSLAAAPSRDSRPSGDGRVHPGAGLDVPYQGVRAQSQAIVCFFLEVSWADLFSKAFIAQMGHFTPQLSVALACVDSRETATSLLRNLPGGHQSQCDALYQSLHAEGRVKARNTTPIRLPSAPLGVGRQMLVSRAAVPGTRLGHHSVRLYAATTVHGTLLYPDTGQTHDHGVGENPRRVAQQDTGAHKQKGHCKRHHERSSSHS